jgi:hypothetical protein
VHEADERMDLANSSGVGLSYPAVLSKNFNLQVELDVVYGDVSDSAMLFLFV